MLQAQEYHQVITNRQRGQEPVFQAAIIVWLNVMNIGTQQLAVKLDNRRLRHLPIIETIGSSAFHLELLSSMKIHSLCDVSKLELATDDTYKGQIQSPPLKELVDREEETQVKDILNSRIRWKRLAYLI